MADPQLRNNRVQTKIMVLACENRSYTPIHTERDS